MKTALLIALIVLTDAAGDVLLTRGMKQVGDVSGTRLKEVISTAWKVITNRCFLFAIFLLCFTFVSFLTVLSWADLSLVFPATSLVYLVSTLGAKFILKEPISVLRWGGIALVCAGVALISLPQ